MGKVVRTVFYWISRNQFLNNHAKKWGLHLGAHKFVAGVDYESVINSVRALNEYGMSGTIDHLGEFVRNKEEAISAKNNILQLLDIIKNENLDCHLSIKLTQLGLDIDEAFCIANISDILQRAEEYSIFVNIDMEDYSHYDTTLKILLNIRSKYKNVGSVIQSYLYRAEDDLQQLEDIRLRIVKGAYKESSAIAYRSKKDIDRNFLTLAKKRLLGESFTSIATHDHHIIEELKAFIKKHDIPRETFEFQMLYGFRTELAQQLVQEGYSFCTYIPFGEDWFGYYMRRIAERPQNLQIVGRDIANSARGAIKKEYIVGGALALASLLYYNRGRKKRRNK